MKKTCFILLLALFITSCKKPNNAINFEGTYTGTFKVTYPHGTESNDAEIYLDRPNFSVNKGRKLGSGQFLVGDKKTITFTDKNVWTTDFDFNLVLNGSYTFEALGDSLILTKYLPAGNFTNKYQYRLRRSPK